MYFNSRMYTDCKFQQSQCISSSSYFNSRMYTDCKGHGINSRPCPAPCFPFREPHVRDLFRRNTQGASHNHGELLDLFFARLLPSGTGDFDAGPSQLREKQTNPIMLLPYPLTGRCFFDLNGTRIYTDCKSKDERKMRYTIFQLAHVHGLQVHQRQSPNL